MEHKILLLKCTAVTNHESSFSWPRWVLQIATAHGRLSPAASINSLNQSYLSMAPPGNRSQVMTEANCCEPLNVGPFLMEQLTAKDLHRNFIFIFMSDGVFLPSIIPMLHPHKLFILTLLWQFMKYVNNRIPQSIPC